MIRPISENRLMVEWNSFSEIITPISDSGSEAMIASGCRKLPNWLASTM